MVTTLYLKRLEGSVTEYICDPHDLKVNGTKNLDYFRSMSLTLAKDQSGMVGGSHRMNCVGDFRRTASGACIGQAGSFSCYCHHPHLAGGGQQHHGGMTHSYSASNFLSAEDEKIEEMIRDLPEGSGMKGTTNFKIDVNAAEIMPNRCIIPGLRDWLKSLRLHKYTRILLELTYEQLLDLTDEELERRGVTLGARGKILKNIGFMKDRPNILAELSFNLDVSHLSHFCDKQLKRETRNVLGCGSNQ